MTIEVCCGGYKDAIAAYRGGADRVELCSDILYGGLTPTLGTLALTKENTSLECSCMLRCREGGFCYDGHEFAVMKKDAELFISMGSGLRLSHKRGIYRLRDDGARVRFYRRTLQVRIPQGF